MGNAKTAIVVIILILLAGGAWWYAQKDSFILPIASGDTVVSWNFQGARNDGGTLEESATKEIARLQTLLGGDQTGGEGNPTDYELYVGIANQYEGLGDGARAREYLEKALAIDSEKTGLAWHNLGNLMSRLGAKNTARLAYEKAVKAQSKIDMYTTARLRFLMDNFASDTGAIDDAFVEAQAEFGDDPSILQMQALWFEKSGRVQEALDTLRRMKAVMPADAQSSIDSEIARLEKKL